MIASLLIAGALAGEPPLLPIPWDSVWVSTKAAEDTTAAERGYWFYYISREDYEVKVLGRPAQAIELEKELKELNALLQQIGQKKGD